MVTQLSNTVVDTQCEGQFQFIPGLSSGLTYVLSEGIFVDGVQTSIPQTTLTLADDDINFIVINFDNTPATLETGIALPNKGLLLYKITTASGVVSATVDLRWRAMASRLLAPTWINVVTGLDPDVWYSLDESSLPFVHQGSAPEEIDLDTGPGPSAFQQAGPTAAGSAASFLVGDSIESVGDGLAEINGSTPSATGTFVYVFHADVKEGFNWIAEGFAGFDTDGIGIRTNGGTLQFQLQDGGVSNYNQQWNPGTVGGANTGVMDDQWHMVVMIQTGAGGDESVIGYLDGTVLPSPDTFVIEGGIVSTYWVPDFGGGDAIVIGGRGNPNENYMRGEVDEFVYFDGVQLTAGNVTDLWDSISGATARTESLGNAIVDLFALPHIYLPLQAEALDEYNSLFSSATNKIGPFTQDGVLDIAAAGFNSLEHAVGSTATATNAGDRLIDASFSPSDDTFDLASGTVGFMFQIDTNHSWDETIWATSDTQSAVFQEGWMLFTVDTTGGGAGGQGRLILQVVENNPDRSQWILNLHNEGVIDVTDGNWHQVLIAQPNDGNGITWYVDGREYTPSNTYWASGHTSSFGDDGWFVDIKDDVDRFGIGGNAAPTETAAFSGKVSHWFLDSKVVNATEATRLWDATGL